jgi:hypothetical protein
MLVSSLQLDCRLGSVSESPRLVRRPHAGSASSALRLSPNPFYKVSSFSNAEENVMQGKDDEETM